MKKWILISSQPLFTLLSFGSRFRVQVAASPPFLEDGILVSQPSPLGNAIKLSGRTFLAPHRGSSPKGLCKRTGFLGVKRRENPVRRHFERSEMRGLRGGIAWKCWNIDSIVLFNIARYTASMPLLPSALPPKGEARHYVANDFLNLITLPCRERCSCHLTAWRASYPVNEADRIGGVDRRNCDP